MALSLVDLLARRMLYSEGCWEWNGHHTAKGYAQLSRNGREDIPTDRVHRLMYQLLIGPIPEGLDPDHLCRNRGCVNPWHLEPVTRRENLMRGETLAAKLAVRTHCDEGHRFDEANTYYRKDGSRRCRECNRIACRAYGQRRKVASASLTGALALR